MSFHVLMFRIMSIKRPSTSSKAADGISVCAPGKMERAALLEAVVDAQALDHPQRRSAPMPN